MNIDDEIERIVSKIKKSNLKWEVSSYMTPHSETVHKVSECPTEGEFRIAVRQMLEVAHDQEV
jgi:hypothetical protein